MTGACACPFLCAARTESRPAGRRRGCASRHPAARAPPRGRARPEHGHSLDRAGEPHERHPDRKGPRRARRRGLPRLPAPRPQTGQVLDRRRHSRRPRALALRPPRAPRRPRQLDRRCRGHLWRPPRSHPPPHGRRADARRHGRGPRLPRPAGCAGIGLGRHLRSRRGGAPPLAALPRDRRHACRGVPQGTRHPPLPLLRAPLPSRALLPGLRRRAPPAGPRRRRHRQRGGTLPSSQAPGSRRHRWRPSHLARPPASREGSRVVPAQDPRPWPTSASRSCGA